MKIVMTLLCRNEQDIIEHNIEYHLAQGVDFFIVMNNLSTDGTNDILRRYEKRGVIKLIQEKRNTHNQAVWVTSMAQLAYNEFHADWVINNDADEFWWPRQGNLRTTLLNVPLNINSLSIKRHNFPPTKIRSTSAKYFYETMIYKEKISLNSRGKPIGNKVCHRAHPQISVSDGNHHITYPNNYSNASRTDQIEIFHFPIRSFKQFETKIVNGANALKNNTRISKNVGATWNELYKLYEQNKLYEYYNDLLITDNLSPLPSNISLDERLRNFMEISCPMSA